MAGLKGKLRGAKGGGSLWVKGADGKFNGSVSTGKAIKVGARLVRARRHLAKRESELAKRPDSPKAIGRLKRAQRALEFQKRALERAKGAPRTKPSKGELLSRALARVKSEKAKLFATGDDRKLKALRNRIAEAKRRGAKLNAAVEMRRGKALLEAGYERSSYKTAKWRLKSDNADYKARGVPIRLRSTSSVILSREKLRAAIKAARAKG